MKKFLLERAMGIASTTDDMLNTSPHTREPHTRSSSSLLLWTTHTVIGIGWWVKEPFDQIPPSLSMGS